MERQKDPRLTPVIIFISVIYAVGAAGLIFPATRHFFEKLVPLNILLSVVLLFYFHHPWKLSTVVTLAAAFAFGFLMEVIGVNTGKIFGNYTYGDALGLKIFGTPVIIGLNWLLLTYLSNVSLGGLRIRVPLKVLIAALLMTAMDFMIEPIAGKFDFWHWENESVPFRNFFAWFAISLLLQSFFNVVKPVNKNILAMPLLVIQFVFFLLLNILAP
jgi:putative membrane protein